MKGFIRHSFRRQLFIVFLAVTLALVLFGGILTIQGFQARIRADHGRQDEEQAKIISERILTMVELSETVIESIASNETIRDIVSGGKDDSQEVYSILYEETAGIRDFAVVDIYRDGECLYTTGSGGLHANLPEEYAVLKEAAEAMKKDGSIVYALDPSNTSAERSDLLIAKMISSITFKSTWPPKCFVIVRIGNAQIESQLSGLVNSRDGYMLTNRFLRPFCLIGTAKDYSSLALIRSNLFAGFDYDAGAKNNIYISELEKQGLLCVYITPPALEESAVRAGYRIIVFLVVISILVCLFAASRMTNLVAKPINTLSSAMRRFRKGDFDVKIDLNREDEFGQLATGFNKMTGQLKKTMEEQVAAERSVNEARTQMMQAQLNPHFLYNTLDTIKWVAKANQVPEIATLSSSLAAVLRMSISGDKFCTLAQEIEMVRNYCEIQKIRFDDSFDLSVDIGDCADAVIPKLILQPLVENSIIHGLEGRRDGHIVICAEKYPANEGTGEELKITVRDNGMGISDEMIAALESENTEALSGHLGLNNINTIIRLTYGERYGVSAARPEEGGTLMTVVLPYSLTGTDNAIKG
jgi:two-component system sensor histidine kinase YesM